MAPQLKDAIAKVLTATRNAGKKAGIYCGSGQQAKLFADQGFDMMSAGADYTALEATLKESLSHATGTAEPSRGVSY